MSRAADIPRANFVAQREIPNRYSKLLETVSRGHALFSPESAVRPQRGGVIGDGGYIDKGIFFWLFNVFDSPPDGLSGLTWSEHDDVLTQGQSNMPGDVMKSSSGSTVKFRSSLGADASSLPVGISPINVEPQVSLQESTFAFLAFAGQQRVVKALKRPRRAEMKAWLVRNYEDLHALYEGDVVMICETVQASGWVGGLAYHDGSEISGNVQVALPGIAQFGVGFTREHDVQMDLVSTRGPHAEDWTPSSPPIYTVIVGLVVARRQMTARLRRRLLTVFASQGGRTSSSPSESSSSQSTISTALVSCDSGQTASPTSNSSVSEATDSVSTDASERSDCEDGDEILLHRILDDVLLRYDNMDMAVADCSLITDYTDKYAQETDVRNLEVNYECARTTGPRGENIVDIVRLIPTTSIASSSVWPEAPPDYVVLRSFGAVEALAEHERKYNLKRKYAYEIGGSQSPPGPSLVNDDAAAPDDYSFARSRKALKREDNTPGTYMQDIQHPYASEPSYGTKSRQCNLCRTKGITCSGDEAACSKQSTSGKPYAGNQPGRVQFSACGGCRHRRIKCDLKDKIARFPDVDPATLQCSNCIERRFACVDEYTQTKAKKQLRKGRRLLEVKARYGERDSVQHPHPADLQVHQSDAIPRLHPDFFNSRFFGRFQIQRPVLHPVEFSTKYCNWLETGDRAVLSREGELIGMVLAAWAASYGIDAAGNAEPHLGDESVSARKERTKEIMREILHLVDVFGILRKPDWDGVQALLLILPLTEEVIDPLERLTIYETAVAQVYTLCRTADVHTISGGGDDSTKDHVRARIFWYAHVHEGITTGLKGGRLILQQEDIDAFNKEYVNPANAHALVMGASTSDRFAFRFATIPIRIAAACRKIHAALTGPRAKGKTDVDRGKLNDAWEALDTSYEELDTIIREIPPTELLSVEDISRFAHGWKIFIYECQNRILNGLEDKVRDLKQQPLTSHIEEVIDDADLARQESHYANILRDNQHLVEIARSKCLNLAHEVAALVRQYLGSSFFEYDAALVRDGSFHAGYLLADEPGCEEQVNDCLRAMDEMRWAFSKSAQYREDLKMKMDARALRERQAIQQLAAANNDP